MARNVIVVSIVGLMLATATVLNADTKVTESKEDKTPDVKAKASPPEVLLVNVVSVSGPAQLLAANGENPKWEPLKAGMNLGENTVIRTGLRAKVVLKFSDRGEVTVKNGTKMGIGEFRKQGTKVKMRLGLKYGSVRASVDSTRGPNDWKVSTPTATLSVRGSVSDFGWLVDIGTWVMSYEGTWNLTSGVRGDLNVGAGEATSGILQHYFELIQMVRELRMIDVHGGLSKAELKFFRSGNSGGWSFGIVNGNNGGNFRATRVTSNIMPAVVVQNGTGQNGRDEGDP